MINHYILFAPESHVESKETSAAALWLGWRVQRIERSGFSLVSFPLFQLSSGVFERNCFFFSVNCSSPLDSYCSFHLPTDQIDFCPQQGVFELKRQCVFFNVVNTNKLCGTSEILKRSAPREFLFKCRGVLSGFYGRSIVTHIARLSTLSMLSKLKPGVPVVSQALPDEGWMPFEL